ncbi:MAG: hypothetical protein HRU22_17245, partial [Gammaproteobacteria bacterium]|nr:hypothetical protein [Gammaproteobacteria bacterium]
MNNFLPKKYQRSKISLLIVSLLSVSGTAVNAEESAQVTDIKGLEVIEVTAQKRVQNLQEVPVSVSGFSGDLLT